ncbi:MAG: hypothetical protein ABIO06_00600 [Pseudolysinimonas sp.]
MRLCDYYDIEVAVERTVAIKRLDSSQFFASERARRSLPTQSKSLLAAEEDTRWWPLRSDCARSGSILCLDRFLRDTINVAGVIAMSTQFELRLIGADAPQGQINVDDVVGILQKLQELATKIGRVETEAADRGRPSKQVERVAKLRLVGLTGGSTVIQVERVEEDGTLDFDLDHESGFDARFAAIIEAIGDDERPLEVSDTLAETTADLVAVLQKAAPEIEFSLGGVVRRTFRTAETHRETWKPVPAADSSERVTVVGRLYAVNLKTHRLQVQDDVGNEFALPRVDNDSSVAHLLGGYVTVTGSPDRDSRGRLSEIRDAEIAAAPGLDAAAGLRESVSLDEILAAPGPTAGGLPGLTDDEATAFLEALRA